MNQITLDQYPGFGSTPAEMSGVDGAAIAAEVMKALQANGTLPRTGQTGISALGIEEMSSTLASAEIRERQLHFWRDMPKDPAYSMVVEYSRVDGLGEGGSNGFIDHTDSGNVTDPSFFRGSQAIKFLAVKGSVTLPTQLIKLAGFNGVAVNAMETSEELKMLELLRHAERNLFYANDGLDSIQWQGVFQQIDALADADNMIRYDLRGASPDKDLLERLGQVFANNSADPTHLYMSNTAYRDIRQSLFPQQRSDENRKDGSLGHAATRFLIEELGGDPDYVKLRRTQILTRGVKGGMPSGVPTTTPLSSAPAAPTSVTLAAAGYTGTSGAPGLDAGTYTYWVCAVGKGGRSAATQSSTNQAATQGQKITLTINHAAPATVLYYELYRIPNGTEGAVQASARFFDRVTCGGAAQTYDDKNANIPGCGDMGMFQLSFDEIQFKQLLPVVKRILPQDLMGNSYGILLFGTPVVRVPTHNVHIVNVGERTQTGVAGV